RARQACAGDLRHGLLAPPGCRGGGGKRRHLHHLPRATAATGLQRGPPQRQHRAMRQLSADPVLRAGRGLTVSSVVIVAYIDGGARGNPGPAGFGARIEASDGVVLAELHGGLGVATNNVAEYNGLLAALGWARDHGHTTVHVKADSLLLVEQMR